MYNVLHDSKEEIIQQVATEIDQIRRAMYTVQPISTVYGVLASDMEEALKRYWNLTGHYFFINAKMGQPSPILA